MKWVKPLYDPEYDRLWEVCQDLEIPVNVHSGTGNPDYGPYPTSMLLYINEVVFYTQRPFVQLTLSGVFERFPQPQVRDDRGRLLVGAAAARRSSTTRSRASASGATGEIRYSKDQALAKNATDYFHQNVWMGVSQPRDADVEARHDRRRSTGSCGAATTRTTRARTRTPASTCGRGSATSTRSRCKKMLSENVAKLYDFDLDALRPLADKIGPTVGEIATPIDDGAREGARAHLRRHGHPRHQVDPYVCAG